MIFWDDDKELLERVWVFRRPPCLAAPLDLGDFVVSVVLCNGVALPFSLLFPDVELRCLGLGVIEPSSHSESAFR